MASLLILLAISLAAWCPCTNAAEQEKVKYQISSESATFSAAPSNYTELSNNTIKLVTVTNSASYGISNPDFAIMSVTLKSSLNVNSSGNGTRRKRSTTSQGLYTNLLMVNSDLKPMGFLEIANGSSTKTSVCPTSNSSTVSAPTSSYAFLAYISSSFSSTVQLTVNLDFTSILLGNSISSVLDTDQRSVLHMVEITWDQVSYRKSIEFRVNSSDDSNATMYISPYCPAVLSDHYLGYEWAKLSFSEGGSFSLHHSSMPKIAPQRYYIRIELEGTPAKQKNVTLSIQQGYDYTVFVPLSLYCLVCLFFASMITWGFFRVFSYCCDLPCYASWRRTLMGWCIRGEKGYAYWTLVVGIVVLLGEIATVLKAYDRMVSGGDRDQCFYNEKCYRVVDVMDGPTNSVTSNLSFLLHGIMCLIVISLMESKCGENNHIHEHSFSLAYSLGTAHVLQALCAGLYAVCPSRLTQSYDITFLYITLGLYIACLFDRGSINYVKDQKLSRFCSIPTKPVRASKFYMFLIGPLLILQYTEAAFSTWDWHSSTYKTVFYSIFFLWMVLVHCWIAFKAELFPMDFYRWLTDGRCDPDHPEFCNWWDCYSYKMKRDSGYGWKMMLFVLHTLISVTFAAYEAFFCDSCSFSYFFLGWLLSGLVFALLYSLFDQINLENKFAHSSWHTNFTWVRVIYSLLVIAAWSAAVYTYRAYDLSSPLKTPQESRKMNKECIFFDYYDGNDMFSLITSFAMLATTYLVIYLNYPCVECVSSHYGIEYTGKRFSMSLKDGQQMGTPTKQPLVSGGGSCAHGGCGGGSKCSKGGGHGAAGGHLSCGCNGSCGCAKKSCGCSIKSICDCKQREASKRSSCKGGCPHSAKSNFSRHDSFRNTKDSGMTDMTGMSDDISYINISDDVPDPQIIFKDEGTSKYPSVVLKSGDKDKSKTGYFY